MTLYKKIEEEGARKKIGHGNAPQNCLRIPKEVSASGFLRKKDKNGILDGCVHV